MKISLRWGITVIDTLQPEAKTCPGIPEISLRRAPFVPRLHLDRGVVGTRHACGRDRRGSDTTLEVMMPGGGYAFSPTHMLQDNSPTENVVAMYEAARRYGGYEG